MPYVVIRSSSLIPTRPEVGGDTSSLTVNLAQLFFDIQITDQGSTLEA